MNNTEDNVRDMQKTVHTLETQVEKLKARLDDLENQLPRKGRGDRRCE